MGVLRYSFSRIDKPGLNVYHSLILGLILTLVLRVVGIVLFCIGAGTFLDIRDQ